MRSPSIYLLDQARAIGAERVRGYRGTLTTDQYRAIHAGLREMMSFAGDDGEGRDRLKSGLVTSHASAL